MGKKIEDLRTLDDRPIEHRVEAPDLSAVDDLRDLPWFQFIGTLDDLLEGGHADWAADTLGGIRETVVRTQRVTEGQRRAVLNIEARVDERRYGRGRGWGGGYGGRRGW